MSNSDPSISMTPSDPSVPSIDGLLERLNLLATDPRHASGQTASTERAESGPQLRPVNVDSLRQPVPAQPPTGPTTPLQKRPAPAPAPAPAPTAAPASPPPAARPVAQAVAPAPSASGPSVLPGESAVSQEPFCPREPRSFVEAELSESEVEALILKYLLARGEDAGQGIAEQVRIPFSLISELLRRMKYDQLIHYRGTTSINDYVVELTDVGRNRARLAGLKSTYYGSAPVSLERYAESVAQQSLTHQHPCQEDLERAFSDLLIDKRMFFRLGAAMNSGRGMFLFGYPGNGKTSIAERVTRAFGEHIWIPRCIGVDGEIVRVFDPAQHIEAPLDDGGGLLSQLRVDHRWVRIVRPTIIVGGELTMENLELSNNETTGINEAPVQLKSNCGTLVIDDFGRQRMTTDELLNRWIVPLEKRYDFLNLPSGKKIQVPFDQLVIFSTNLEPKDLVDDAFLRRIPYKIEVENPTEENFRKLFGIMCPIMGFEYDPKVVDYLIEKHYRPTNRPFRCCQPRDLLLQIKNLCLYTRQPICLRPEYMDAAAANYFSMI